jgi:hypothetical protein
LSAVSDLIGVLLPGGLAVGVVALFQAYKSWQEGRASREETAIKRWQQLAAESDERSKIAEQDEAHAILLAEYWRTCYAELEFEARRQGVQIPDRPVMPVKKMRGVTSGASSRRRIRQGADDDA